MRTLERPAPVLHSSAAADLTQRFNEAAPNQPPAPTSNDLVAFINEFSIDEATMEHDEQQREDPNSGAPSNDTTAPNDTTMVISSDDNDEPDGAAPNLEVLAPPNPAPPVQPAPFQPPVPIATSTQLPVMAAIPPPRPAALFQQRSPMAPFQQRPPTALLQRSTATLIPQLQFAFGGAPLQPMQARTFVRPFTPVTPLALSTAIAATATATMAASATYQVTSSGLGLPPPPPEYQTISPPDDNNSAPRKRRRRDDAAAQEQADEEREHEEEEGEQEQEEEHMDTEAETEAPENAPTTSHDTAPAHAITDFGRATLTITGGEDVVADGVNFSDRNALLYVESHVLGRFPEAVRFVLMGMARLFGATPQTVPGQAYGGPPESASYIIFGTDTARIRRGAPLLHAPARAQTLTSRLRPNAEARLPVSNSDATVISIILIRLADPAILDRLPAWVTDAAAGFVGVYRLGGDNTYTFQLRYDHGGDALAHERFIRILDALTYLQRDDEITHVSIDAQTQTALTQHVVRAGTRPLGGADAQQFPAWFHAILMAMFNMRRAFFEGDAHVNQIPIVRIINYYCTIAALRALEPNRSRNAGEFRSAVTNSPLRLFTQGAPDKDGGTCHLRREIWHGIPHTPEFATADGHISRKHGPRPTRQRRALKRTAKGAPVVRPTTSTRTTTSAAASASASAAPKVTLKVARSLFGSESVVRGAQSKMGAETAPAAATRIPFSGPPTARPRPPIPMPSPPRPHGPSSPESEDEPPPAPPKPIVVPKGAVVKLTSSKTRVSGATGYASATANPPQPTSSNAATRMEGVEQAGETPFTGIAPTAAYSHRIPARGVIPQGAGADVVAKPPEDVARQRAEEEAAARATRKSTEQITREDLELPLEEESHGAEDEGEAGAAEHGEEEEEEDFAIHSTLSSEWTISDSEEEEEEGEGYEDLQDVDYEPPSNLPQEGMPTSAEDTPQAAGTRSVAINDLIAGAVAAGARPVTSSDATQSSSASTPAQTDTADGQAQTARADDQADSNAQVQTAAADETLRAEDDVQPSHGAEHEIHEEDEGPSNARTTPGATDSLGPESQRDVKADSEAETHTADARPPRRSGRLRRQGPPPAEFARPRTPITHQLTLFAPAAASPDSTQYADAPMRGFATALQARHFIDEFQLGGVPWMPRIVLRFDFDQDGDTLVDLREVRRQPHHILRLFTRMGAAALAQVAEMLAYMYAFPTPRPVTVAVADFHLLHLLGGPEHYALLAGLNTIDVFCPDPIRNLGVWFVNPTEHPRADRLPADQRANVPSAYAFHYDTRDGDGRTPNFPHGRIGRYLGPAEQVPEQLGDIEREEGAARYVCHELRSAAGSNDGCKRRPNRRMHIGRCSPAGRRVHKCALSSTPSSEPCSAR